MTRFYKFNKVTPALKSEKFEIKPAGKVYD
jgi:hypothetical protein